jgi:hypothetical protein
MWTHPGRHVWPCSRMSRARELSHSQGWGSQGPCFAARPEIAGQCRSVQASVSALARLPVVVLALAVEQQPAQLCSVWPMAQHVSSCQSRKALRQGRSERQPQRPRGPLVRPRPADRAEASQSQPRRCHPVTMPRESRRHGSPGGSSVVGGLACSVGAASVSGCESWSGMFCPSDSVVTNDLASRCKVGGSFGSQSAWLKCRCGSRRRLVLSRPHRSSKA